MRGWVRLVLLALVMGALVIGALVMGAPGSPAVAFTTTQRPPDSARRGDGRFVFVACPAPDGGYKGCRGQSPQEQVLAQEADTTTQLTGRASRKWSPVWSPGGGRVAYTSTTFYASDGDCPAYSMPVHGRRRFLLKKEEFACVEPVDWSPGGRWILMIAWYYEGGPNLFRVHPDGTGLERITCFFEGGPSNALFFHGGKKIVFSGTKDYDDEQGIYTMRVDGKRLHLIYGAAGEYEPYELAISPDRRTVVFETNPRDESPGEIYSIGVDGAGLAPLTTNENDELDLAYSPDGTKLAFALKSGGRLHPTVVDLESGPIAPLPVPAGTRLTTEGQRLAWSPSGDKLAFVAAVPHMHRRAVYWSDLFGHTGRATDYVRALDF